MDRLIALEIVRDWVAGLDGFHRKEIEALYTLIPDLDPQVEEEQIAALIAAGNAERDS